MSGAQRLTGTPASPGRAAGPAFVYRPRQASAPAGSRHLSPDEARVAVQRFRRAVEQARSEIEAALDEVSGEPAHILGAHLMMLADPLLVDATLDRIASDRIDAGSALFTVIAGLADSLRNVGDDYLRSRAADVEDVGRRLWRHLRGGSESADQADLALAPAGSVVVAIDLTPSEVLTCRQAGILALALEAGAANSHALILARSFRMPAVVGVAGLMDSVTGGTGLVVDGDEGEVTTGAAELLPGTGPSTIGSGRRQPTPSEARTADGRRVWLYANLSRPEELEAALEAGAEGIGVLRTEFLFLERLPSEEEQYQAYRALAEALEGKPLIVRTLDVGGDKPLPYLQLPPEANPFLGLRGLRLSLARPELLLTQLRAILRASAHGCVKLMYPMVTDVSELVDARAVLEQARQELKAEGAPTGEVKVGAMVEVPAAAICADQLAREAAFLSVGTNDLAQYALAADRSSPTVASLYSQTHLAVLRLLKATVEGARRWKRPVAVCGEMASDPAALPGLVGLGVDELSMAPPAIERVRQALANISYSREARRLDALLTAT